MTCVGFQKDLLLFVWSNGSKNAVEYYIQRFVAQVCS